MWSLSMLTRIFISDKKTFLRYSNTFIFDKFKYFNTELSNILIVSKDSAI